MSKYSFNEEGVELEVFEPISFIKPEKISIGHHVRLSEFSLISGGDGLYIGNYVHIANHVSIIGGGVCVIEDFVGVASGTRIITGSDDIIGAGIPSPMVPPEFRSFYRSHVIIKKHAFISTNVIIHPGLTISEGAVVASGSLVTKDLEPWGVYMGTPARKIRDRKKDTILKMEQKIYEKEKIKASDFDHILVNINE
jgi:acetyltransferase-like isoleucine patch superfamily enzyme